MKNIRSITTILSAAGLALVGSVSTVNAAPPGATSTPQFPRQLHGSDTLNAVIDAVFVTLAGATPNGYVRYSGIGSTGGENQLEGSPGAGEPTCTPNDANGGTDTNPGCQEIAPMSRALDSSICEDEESADKAEGLYIAKDALAIVAHNSVSQYYRSTCPSPAPAAVPTPNDPVPPSQDYTFANTPGGDMGANWQNSLRLIYTGCESGAGNCSAVARSTRCNSAARQTLVSNFNNIITGTACGPTNPCPTGLRRAYRRDDVSGTTQVFAETIGMGPIVRTARARIVAVGGALQALSETHTFCDGGQFEGFFPAPDGTRGDPITTACSPEDDLCGPNGRTGLVRAIRSPLPPPNETDPENVLNYPTVQCTRGRFERKQFLNTSQPVCPDGTAPLAGLCNLPYFNDTASGTRNFHCLNDPNSRPSTVPSSVDGRSYNYVVRTPAGAVQYADSGNLMPQVASWRENMATLDTVLPVPGGPLPGSVCNNLTDATRVIGCLVANSQCTIGFAGREAAIITPWDDQQEPLKLNGIVASNENALNETYPFQRNLFINAIGGAERIMADCLDRSPVDPDVCQDQINIWDAFYNYSATAQNAIRSTGYVPLPGGAQCIGATGTAGCGAPTSQPLSACDATP